MSALKTKHVETNFLNIIFFLKGMKNTKNNANTSKIYF